MKSLTTRRTNKVKQYNFIAAALVGTTASLPVIFAISLPVLAEGTPAGTTIENRATGTFEDPNNPGIPIPVESNSVILTVAEVAGITVQGNGVREADGNSQIDLGDLLYFRYLITNVGNDPTRFRIPNSATVTGSGTLTGNLQISTDGGQNWSDISGNEAITPSIAADSSILVRVPVTVNSSATDDDEIVVQLGRVPNDSQNVERVADITDVYTVDNPDGAIAGEVTGVPANGTREASATQRVSVTSRPLALATLYKVHGTPVEANNPNIATDDVITYQLALNVRSTIPPGSGGFVPGTLAATTGIPLTVDGSAINRILVSDAIPAGTVLINDSWQIPQGWQAIFTSDDPSAVNANVANWRTDPASLGGMSNVRRIGFVFDGTIAAGTTVEGFEFKVVTSGITGTTTIANIAQVFGATEGNPDVLVYDESGDQLPNNFNDDGTLPPVDPTGNPVVSPGVPNVETDGQDSSNNNTASGPGGEPNVVVISPVFSGIQNGPSGSPGAVGPTDDNDDFTNQVIPISPNVPPPPVSYTNTVVNSTNEPITIAPVPPKDPNSLPAGTTVTITYGGRSVTYTYNPATGFTTNDTPIVIPPGESPADYAVDIQLPNAEPNRAYDIPIAAFIDRNGDGKFDTDEPGNVTINRLYTGVLEIVKESRILRGSGPEVIPGQEIFSGEVKTPSPGNIIEYRVTYRNFSTVGSTGNVRLDARNIVISEDGTTYDRATNPGGNNWALDTDNLDEDGEVTTGIDTSHAIGSAIDSTGGEIEFFRGLPATTPTGEQSGTTVDTDVTKYVVRVRGTLGPGQQGTFTFRRQVN